MRHQQGGRTSTEDVASWRQPDVAELAVLAQQVVVLGFANFHSTPEPTMHRSQRTMPDNCGQEATASRTLSRGAVPSGIMKCGLRLSAMRTPFLRRTLACADDHDVYIYTYTCIHIHTFIIDICLYMHILYASTHTHIYIYRDTYTCRLILVGFPQSDWLQSHCILLESPCCLRILAARFKKSSRAHLLGTSITWICEHKSAHRC